MFYYLFSYFFKNKDYSGSTQWKDQQISGDHKATKMGEIEYIGWKSRQKWQTLPTFWRNRISQRNQKIIGRDLVCWLYLKINIKQYFKNSSLEFHCGHENASLSMLSSSVKDRNTFILILKTQLSVKTLQMCCKSCQLTE